MWTREFVRHVATHFDARAERIKNRLSRNEHVEKVLGEELRDNETVTRWVQLAQKIEQERATCSECKRIHDSGKSLAPTHRASSRCESGGHPHCTCDICF